MREVFFYITLAIIVASSCFSTAKAQQWNVFTTNYGYIKLGPADNNWGHIYTDKSKFLFNKDIHIATGGISSQGREKDLLLKTNGNTRVTIDYASGNVGIGILHPEVKLEVDGGGRFHGGILVEHIEDSDWHYALSVWVNRDKTKAFTVNTTTGDNLFTIWGNGVVQAKKIYAEEIQVRVDALTYVWPDFVFKNEYQLMSLNEVDSFIKKNQHLPNVPSEKEIIEKGVNLGEMNAVLLQKIEELTLYLISQQNEINELKKIVNDNK